MEDNEVDNPEKIDGLKNDSINEQLAIDTKSSDESTVEEINLKLHENDVKKKEKIPEYEEDFKENIARTKSLDIRDLKKKETFNKNSNGLTWKNRLSRDTGEDFSRLFCGNLSDDVTDDMLADVFKKYSSFQSARVVRDKKTNHSKGYGFVTFADPRDSDKAMIDTSRICVGTRALTMCKYSRKPRTLEIVIKKEKKRQVLLGVLTGYSRV